MELRRRLTAALVAVVVAFAALVAVDAAPAAAAPPSNDSFASPQVMAADLPITALSRNIDATNEAGEPQHAGSAGVGSVWFSWTPAVSGPVVIDTCDSSSGFVFDTLLAVYTGTAVDAL